VLLLASLVALSAAQSSVSLGELATGSVPGNYSAVLTLLPGLNSTTLPQDVALLRKQVLFLRDLIDVFIFVYPTPAAGQQDVWVMLREDANVGYTLIGNFQDLNHSGVNYTHAEYEARLQVCLQWQAGFYAHAAKYNYSSYAASPATNGSFYYRASTDETQFFWGDAGVLPNPDISGLANIVALTDALLQLGVKRYPIVLGLPEMYTNNSHTTFHDYRKLARSINWLAVTFPIFDSGTYANISQLGLNVTNTLYDLFGNLNDEATAYMFYEEYGTPQLEASQRVIVQQGWFALKTWLQAVAYDLVLVMLGTVLVSG